MAGIISKFVVFIVNIAFFIVGTLVMVFGILLLTDPSAIQSALMRSTGYANLNYIINLQQAMVNNGILLTVVGGVIFLISFIGIVGTCRKGSCLIASYLGLILLTLLFELAIIIYAAVDYSNIQTRVQDLMFSALQQNFQPVQIGSGGVISNGTTPGGVAWETLQFTYGCCGAHNYTDYEQFTTWKANFTYNTNANFPPSCCIQNTQYQVPATTTAFVNFGSCISASTSPASLPAYVNTKGCHAAVLETFQMQDSITIIIIASLIALEIIVVMLVLHLLHIKTKVK
jgi:hypothetical protein